MLDYHMALGSQINYFKLHMTNWLEDSRAGRKIQVPTAAAVYGRQLKKSILTPQISKTTFLSLSNYSLDSKTRKQFWFFYEN